MKRFFLALLLAIAPAFVFAGDYIFTSGNDTVRVHDRVCENPKAAAFAPEVLRPTLGAATAMVGGTLYQGCWTVRGNAVHVFYDDGDQGLIPFSELKEATSV